MEPEVQGGGDAPLKRARKLTEKAESLLEPVQKVERAKPLKKTTKQTLKAVKPIIATVIKEKAYKVPILNSKDKTCKVLPVNDLHILPSVALSEFDKATQLSLCKDQLVCTGCEGGYRMVRATHGVHRGAYYWEMEMLEPQGPNAHVRVGWATRQGELQAPVGYDQYSFGYRDTGGSRVHNSERHDDYGEGYSAGDVIGCYISLEDDVELNKMVFFKNGVSQGVAYCGAEIPSAVYFPAVSLYMQAVVRCNFGPSFIIRSPEALGANAVSELQPMSPEDRKVHEQTIAAIRVSKGLVAS